MQGELNPEITPKVLSENWKKLLKICQSNGIISAEEKAKYLSKPSDEEEEILGKILNCVRNSFKELIPKLHYEGQTSYFIATTASTPTLEDTYKLVNAFKQAVRELSPQHLDNTEMLIKNGLDLNNEKDLMQFNAIIITLIASISEYCEKLHIDLDAPTVMDALQTNNRGFEFIKISLAPFIGDSLKHVRSERISSLIRTTIKIESDSNDNEIALSMYQAISRIEAYFPTLSSNVQYDKKTIDSFQRITQAETSEAMYEHFLTWLLDEALLEPRDRKKLASAEEAEIVKKLPSLLSYLWQIIGYIPPTLTEIIEKKLETKKKLILFITAIVELCG